MKSGLHISKLTIHYVPFPKKEIGAAIYCKEFKLNLSKIKFIVISPRLALDQETIFTLIVDSVHRIHPMPDRITDSEDYDKFLKLFNIKHIGTERQKFEYDDHLKLLDKIIYPNSEYWNDLFRSDWKKNIRKLYGWFIPKSFFGTIKRN